MNKCLKIVFSVELYEGFLHDFIQKNAKKLSIEGTVQAVSPDKVRIIACGSKENMDAFLDIVHKGTPKAVPEDIEIEPFFKDKDYRGVFRVIE